MIRLLRIAARDYLAYVRTPGFWLSILMMPIGMLMFGFAPSLVAQSTPVPSVALADFTQQGYEQAIVKAFKPVSSRDKPVARFVPLPEGPFATPAQATERLKPYVAGSRTLPGGGQLDAVAILRPSGDTVAIDMWSRNVTDPAVRIAVLRAVTDALRRSKLEKAGVNAEALKSIEDLTPRIDVFSPKAGGKITQRDKLPGLAGFAMGILLWMVVFTGAGMLLNSIIEEKSSRILEVLLSSASAAEIMAGKILGVAGVTATVLVVWLTLAGTVMSFRFPSLAADLGSILFHGWMIAYLALYFVGGYLMFATLYVTVGAFCETTREAQTLLGPMMIVLSLPMVFMLQAITHPESQLLATLSWVPIFTPFMMAARAASNPPLWQIAGTAALMFATTALELWLAGPAFKSGALATGRFELKVFFAALMRRGPA